MRRYTLKKINIIHNDNNNSIKVASTLKGKLENNGYYVPDNYNDKAILNMCVGGDGAFLRAIHNYNFPEIPFIGINTGHLGFFQELSPDDIDCFIDRLKKQDYELESLYLVESSVCTKNSCMELIGVNEIVVKGIKSKTVHLDISINNTPLEKFSGDGVIVSTPSGSTAYNFSAGGSLIYPSLGVLQLTPLAPINSKVYRSLISSVIVPPNMTITINPENSYENSILIVVDGKQYKYDNIVTINFKISNMKINLLTLGNRNFWSDLISKFL